MLKTDQIVPTLVSSRATKARNGDKKKKKTGRWKSKSHRREERESVWKEWRDLDDGKLIELG